MTPLAVGRSRSDARRHPRILFGDAVLICWEDEHGETMYARARCVNISASGICLELFEPVPTRTYVTLRVERGNICGMASVRYCKRVNSKFKVGLEFSTPITQDVVNTVATPRR
jgi:hypothetical protein